MVSRSWLPPLADSGNFGNVCLGSFRDEQLTLNNAGACRLLISNITSTAIDFFAPGVASYPLAIVRVIRLA